MKSNTIISLMHRVSEKILFNYFTWLPDKLYLKLLFRIRMGKRLNLKNPQTFSEKLQWLKLYDRKTEYTMMVDKYAVKDYVAGIIGEEYIIPTIGVWNKLDDIEWDTLPEKFVLKTTYGGGSSGVVICKDKSTFDRQKAIKKLKKSLKQNIYKTLKEWPYKNVPKRIIAEKYIDPRPETNDLPDYKFFCFNGEPKYCQVISGRDSKKCIDFFDRDWNHQPFHEPSYYSFADEEPAKPKYLDKMWQAAEQLAQDKAFSRIDFYEVGDDVFFGEITFFPTSGLGSFEPEDYETIIGKMITLPGVAGGGGIISKLQIGKYQIIQPDLPDYKFFCFDGEVKALFIGTERQSGDVKFDYYDADFNHLDLIQQHPMSGRMIDKPLKFEEMKEIASKISKGIPHARVDLYNINGKIYFGEITFYHHGGLVPFHPEKWDYEFGGWVTLPSKNMPNNKR